MYSEANRFRTEGTKFIYFHFVNLHKIKQATVSSETRSILTNNSIRLKDTVAYPNCKPPEIISLSTMVYSACGSSPNQLVHTASETDLKFAPSDAVLFSGVVRLLFCSRSSTT